MAESNGAVSMTALAKSRQCGVCFKRAKEEVEGALGILPGFGHPDVLQAPLGFLLRGSASPGAPPRLPRKRLARQDRRREADGAVPPVPHTGLAHAHRADPGRKRTLCADLADVCC